MGTEGGLSNTEALVGREGISGIHHTSNVDKVSDHEWRFIKKVQVENRVVILRAPTWGLHSDTAS